MRRLVIGIGNAFRHDDGVGLAVADEIARLGLPEVDVLTTAGDACAVLEAWTDVGLAVIVDAASGGDDSDPGRVRRWRLESMTSCGSLSSHSFGLNEIHALGLALGRMPRSLVVVTVDAADVGIGLGLSNAVADALPKAVSMVLTELGAQRRR